MRNADLIETTDDAVALAKGCLSVLQKQWDQLSEHRRLVLITIVADAVDEIGRSVHYPETSTRVLHAEPVAS